MAMEVTAQLAEHPLPSPRLSRDESRLEQETLGANQRSPQRVQGQHALLSISRVHLYSCRGALSSQGHQKGVQKATGQVVPPGPRARVAHHCILARADWPLPLPPGPKAELKPEKKGPRPQSQGDGGPQRELVIPGVVDFELTPEPVTTSKPQTPGSYRFGRLSHHSFFSRHHPHPQHVTHIQDLTGKPVCVVRDEFSQMPLPESMPLSHCLLGMPTISAPIGDPQSNRNPQLPSEAWKKELKELSSRVATFSKENELKTKEKEEPLREQGAMYSADTGRLIPASVRAVGRRSSRQRIRPVGRDGGQSFLLQDQDLLVLELLCQILQTDSLSAIQFWLLYASPKEKDLALGLLQTAVAQLLPQPLVSIPAEKLLHQLQEVQEPPPQEKQQLPHSSQSLKKMKTPPLPKSAKPEYIGKAQVLRMHSSMGPEEKVAEAKAGS
ncbi:protein TBATA isoform X3 [Ochotona princeps]|uniref:protein TBATA isoform X3 n=1 Tax=Ochotona princeps TaxID=9978 RepID=UPI0027149039|nr:protein TBATA isoform X3 [Ochotona princeps]